MPLVGLGIASHWAGLWLDIHYVGPFEDAIEQPQDVYGEPLNSRSGPSKPC